MDDNTFDALARALGSGRSRRGILKGLGAAALGAAGLDRLGSAAAKGTNSRACATICGQLYGSNLAAQVQCTRQGERGQGPCAACGFNPANYCSGTCTNVATDITNCGACGHVCPTADSCNTPMCSSGVCSSVPTNENGACSGVGSDCTTPMCSSGYCKGFPINEGGPCDNGTGTCDFGTCVANPVGCPTGTTDCNSTCVDLSSDSSNCGACGSSCVAGNECNTATCYQGACYHNSNPAAQGAPCNCGTGTCDVNGNCVATGGGPGTCAAGEDYCLTGTAVTCNGSGSCSCHTTTTGAPFCGIGPAVCADCNVDADCVSAGYGAGAACLDLGTNCSSCFSSTPTHVCMAACTA